MQTGELYKKYLASTGVTTDTRHILSGNIFFALKGEKFNANAFAQQAFEKGAHYVVVDEVTERSWPGKFGDKLIVTEGVLKTLQQLAGYHRAQLNCPVLAITGSNGKTTSKELAAAVLSKKFRTYATKGNLNNHIGIPLTLLSIQSDVEFAIIEMGANHQGEIASYCEYVQPGYGLITNIGLAHTEGFGGFEGVVKGKTELYKYLAINNGKIFVNADNELLLHEIRKLEFGATVANKLPDGIQKPAVSLITYGKSTDVFCNGKLQTNNNEFLSLSVTDNGNEIPISTQLVGDYNFENVLSAVCIGKYFGVNMDKISEAIASYIPGNNRSQKITWGTNNIILDAYNANPSSMSEALKNFEKIKVANKMVILGEMMELGASSEIEHVKIAKSTETMHLSKRIFIGAGFQFLKQDPSVIYFEKTSDLKSWFRQQQFENSCILIKGSRKNELEKILTE